MNPNEQGLTVGELTIVVGILIIGAIAWSSCNDRDNKNNSSFLFHSEGNSNVIINRDIIV